MVRGKAVEQDKRTYTVEEQQEMAALEQQWDWYEGKQLTTGKGKGYRPKEEVTAIGVYARKFGKFPPGIGNRHDKRNLRKSLGLSNDIR